MQQPSLARRLVGSFFLNSPTRILHCEFRCRVWSQNTAYCVQEGHCQTLHVQDVGAHARTCLTIGLVHAQCGRQQWCRRCSGQPAAMD
jgi:hypothetical protein